MREMTKSEMFLKTFFELELRWLWEKKSWVNPRSDHFVMCTMLYSESWSIISENRKEFNLSPQQFSMLDKLYEMLIEFEKKYDFPSTLSEYMTLSKNPDWMKFQQFASEIHYKIYPTL